MTFPSSPLRSRAAKRGFSLVLSLTLMAMLLLLCISAAALIAIELRVSRATVFHAKARLNALAAARIALGSLQGLAGTDKAVTANAAILASEPGLSSQIRRPRLPGVWRARVVSGDYDAAHASAFKGWLMSGTDESGRPLAMRGAANAQSGLNWMLSGSAEKTDADLLLYDGGLTPYAGEEKLRDEFDDAPGSRETLRLYARPEPVDPGNFSGGSIAWVAMDENQKARVDLREYASSDLANGGFAENDRSAFSAAAAARFHPGDPEDGSLKDWSPTSAVPDGRLPGGWASLALDPNGKATPDTSGSAWFPLESGRVRPLRALRHDFTLESATLLTDAVNGGLKRDINTLALMSDGDFSAEASTRFGDALGFVGFDADRSGWFAEGASPVAGLFPLSGNTKLVWPTWADLRQWAKLSTEPGDNGVFVENGVPYVNRIPWSDMKAVIADPASSASFSKNAAWRQPVLSRIRCEVSLESRNQGTQPAMYFKINTVAQIWNPFNVRMKMPVGAYYINFKNLPFISRWYKTDPSTNIGGNGTITNTFYMGIPLGGADLEPGEIRNFSLPTTTNTIVDYSVAMTPAYSPSGGYVSATFAGVGNLAPTDVITYATGRFVNPAEIPSGSTAGYSATPGGGNGSIYLSATDSAPVTGSSPALPGDLVTTIGSLDNKWIVAPGNDPASLHTVGTVADLTGAASVPISIFEYRLKQEKLPVTAGRFSPPPLIYQAGWSWPQGAGSATALNEQDLRACPFELVGWNPMIQKDPERFGDSLQGSGPNVERGFGYTGNQTTSGIPNPVFYHLPLTPPVGIGDLRNARLGGGLRVLKNTSGQDAYCNAYATLAPFSNSLASAFVPLDKVYLATGNLAGAGVANPTLFSGPDAGVQPVDHTWVMNTALADTWFASSLGDWNKGATAALFKVNKDYATQLRDFFERGLPLPNRRLSPVPVPDARDKWVSGNNASKDAYRQLAEGMLVEGGFNINSTSIRAWRAFLSSSRDTKTVKQLAGVFSPAISANIGTALPASIVNDDLVPAGGATTSTNNGKRVSGGRDLSDTELDDLAVALVAEVKKRGPFLSLGEFLNRRVETGAMGYKGAVQSAIDTAKLNDHRTAMGMAATAQTSAALGNPEVDKVYDYSGVGQPGWLSQADLIAPLLPSMTPRGDTFTIRAVGESEEGARAYCEITVRRTYAFVDARDTPDTEFEPATGASQRIVNKTFGRRFVIIARRWLAREDV